MVEPADYPAGRTVRKRHRDKCGDRRKWPRHCIGDHPATQKIRRHSEVDESDDRSHQKSHDGRDDDGPDEACFALQLTYSLELAKFL